MGGSFVSLTELRGQPAVHITLSTGRILVFQNKRYYENGGATLCCNAPQQGGFFVCTKPFGHKGEHQAEDADPAIMKNDWKNLEGVM